MRKTASSLEIDTGRRRERTLGDKAAATRPDGLAPKRFPIVKPALAPYLVTIGQPDSAMMPVPRNELPRDCQDDENEDGDRDFPVDHGISTTRRGSCPIRLRWIHHLATISTYGPGQTGVTLLCLTRA